MPSIDLRSFPNLPHAACIGDITYLPREPERHELLGAHEVLLQRLDRLPPVLAGDLRRTGGGYGAQIAVEAAAMEEAFPPVDAKPQWFDALPDPYRRAAERSFAIHAVENSNILLGFPHTRLGGYVIDLDEGGLLGGAYRPFRLYRLARVRQLAWLTQPLLPQDMPGMYPMRFEHNRLCHVWDVAALANLLAAGLGLPEVEARTLTLAAATHDARTPAGGDTTKLLDRDFFDEDKHYGELLEPPETAALLARFGIPPELLLATVQGQGLLGSLLDLADKTAYLSRDAFWFHMRFEADILDCDEGVAVHNLLRSKPHACDAWRSAALVDGHLVLTDAEALARMLRLRALLFRALYWHPGSRFTEFVVSHLVLRHLYGSGTVTREQLLEWCDEDLDQHVRQYSHFKIGEDFGEPIHEGFERAKEAERRRDELVAQGERCVMIETLPLSIKSGTHFLVLDKHGAPRPLKEAYPELAFPIDALARVLKPHRLYWVPWETIPAPLKKIIADT